MFNFYTLRNRLLASYMFLLLVTLGGIILALFVTTSALPEPANSAYDRLAPIADFLTNPNVGEQVVDGLTVDTENATPSVAGLRENNAQRPLGQVLSLFQDTRLQRLQAMVTRPETRMLLISLNTPGSPPDLPGEFEQQVLIFDNTTDQDRQTGFANVSYDSASRIDEGGQIILEVDNRYNGYRSGNPNKQIYFGTFNENGREWVFSAAPDTDTPTDNRPLQLGSSASYVVVAEPRDTQSLQNLLADFGTSLAGPLFQAGLIGTVIAVALAILISRTIASPLQAAAQAATAVAQGDLDQSVPIMGPKEVRSVAGAFNKMSAEVKATQQAQRDFLANVSHDLKTPLTSIQGYSQAIMEGAARDPKKAAEIIHDEAGRLNRMVEELTDLARIQAGQFSMKHDEIDVGQIAVSVAQRLTVVAEKKNIHMHIKSTRIPTILGDGDRMAQVFTNLISNAIKYTPEGGRVRVQTRETFDGVEIVVRDTGIGIPEEDISRIFERFYQVDKARGPQRGTGLGLAITNEIVIAHGGRIDVQSVQGRGTEFTVWLPQHTRIDPPTTATNSQSHAQAS